MTTPARVLGSSHLPLVLGFPLAVLGVLRYGGLHGGTLVLEVVAAVLLLIPLSRRPDRTLLVLIVLLPFQKVLLGLALAAGAPAALARGFGSVKELLVAGMVVAAVQHGDRRPLDRLDKAVVAFVALAGLYVVAPLVLHGLFAHVSLTGRITAWRTNCLFPIAFLAARRMPVPPGFRRTAGIAVTVVGLIAAGCALIELVSPTTWSHFLVRVVRIRNYQSVVSGVPQAASDGLTHTTLAGHSVVRVGGTALAPIILGFQLLVPLAFCLERITGIRHRLVHALSVTVVTVAIVATLTRSAILATLLLAIVTLRLSTVRLRPGRVQLGVALALTAIVLAPLAGSSAVAQRTTSAFSGDTSTTAHETNSAHAALLILKHPLGLGLGTGPGVGNRFNAKEAVTSEDAYLQVGAELGIVAMLLFLSFLALTMLELRKRARARGPDAGFAGALLAAGVGFVLGGFFLHVWLEFPTALTFWSLAGVALGREQSATAPPAPVPELVEAA